MERYDYLKLFHNISPDAFALLSHSLRRRDFGKGEHIIVPGQVQKELYFINKGVQMSYFESDKKKHVIAFTYPPGISAVPESFALQQPSSLFVTCLGATEADYITYDTLQSLFAQSREIETLFRKMTEVVLAGVLTRHTELHSATIEERYLAFCRRSPHLLHLVPHKYIASYLGMDATNFSKLYNTVQI